MVVKLLFCCSWNTGHCFDPWPSVVSKCVLASEPIISQESPEKQSQYVPTSYIGWSICIWMSDIQVFHVSIPHAGVLYLSLYSRFFFLQFLLSGVQLLTTLLRYYLLKISFSFWQLHNDLTLHISKHPTWWKKYNFLKSCSLKLIWSLSQDSALT